MTYLGKRIRIERIQDRDTGRTVIVPMDHGISMGPIDGLKFQWITAFPWVP